jgi:hypothetical protein
MASQAMTTAGQEGATCAQDLDPQTLSWGPKKIILYKGGTTSGDQGPMHNQTTFFLSASFSVFLF